LRVQIGDATVAHVKAAHPEDYVFRNVRGVIG
jgi:hypothetical protein